MAREESFSAGEPLVARARQDESLIPVRAERTARRIKGYRHVLPQGMSAASSDSSAHQRTPWVRSLGVVVFLVILTVAGYFSAEPIASLLERPLSSVTVEGDFHYLSKERITELISAQLNDDFLHLDLMELKGVLEQDPWVEYASLGRRWPDVLLVKIVEQKPIARWGEKSFMNQRGKIVHVDSVAELVELPALNGNEADAHKILRQYQDLSQLLRTRQLDIQVLSCDAKKAWRITLKGGVEIAVGRDRVMEKIQRFLLVYDEYLHDLWSDVATIDVRYTNGIAVQWLPESSASKQFIKSS